MSIQHGVTHVWRKSSYSAGSGACVEVMSPSLGALAVRDSKAEHGPELAFAAGAWSAFVRTAAPSAGGRGRGA